MQNKPTIANYIWQPLMVFIFLWLCLHFFYMTAQTDALWAVGGGSLASSAYLLFAKPNSTPAHPVRFVVAYVIAVLCGIAMHWSLLHFTVAPLFACPYPGFCLTGFFAALSVMITFMFLIGLRMDHPPALGMALVLVIDSRDYRTALLVIAAVALLVLLKFLFNPWLRDLV